MLRIDEAMTGSIDPVSKREFGGIKKCERDMQKSMENPLQQHRDHSKHYDQRLGVPNLPELLAGDFCW